MLRRHLGNEDLKSGNEETPGQVFSSGVPSNLSRSELQERDKEGPKLTGRF